MLSDRACRAAKPGPKPVKLSDQHGLHLLVRPTGFKSWRMKYRFAGKEKQLVFGPYPEVGLGEAREAMFAARKLLRQGIDPGPKAAAQPQLLTFREAAQNWLELQAHGWKPKHRKTVEGRIEADLYPALGDVLLSDIRPADIVDALTLVQDRGALEVAHRLRGYASAIFESAIARDQAETNPAASVSRALKPKTSRRYPALRTIEDLQGLLRAIEQQPGQPAVKLASRLLALTAARPGMIRWAEAKEFEQLEEPPEGAWEPIWRIPAEKMKLELAESQQEAFEFIIPLSRQAVETVKIALEFAGKRKHLFPSTRHSDQPFTDNALNTNYKRLPIYGGRHVPHGWRSSFSTIMNERAADQGRPGDRAIIDLMLAHKPAGVEATYNRAAYMRQRRLLSQEWADLLMTGMAGPETLLDGPRKR